MATPCVWQLIYSGACHTNGMESEPRGKLCDACNLLLEDGDSVVETKMGTIHAECVGESRDYEPEDTGRDEITNQDWIRANVGFC